jgi:hypothetical protein
MITILAIRESLFMIMSLTPMIPIISIAELHRALYEPRMILFLYVNWSGQARDSELAVKKLLEHWSEEYPEYELPAYRIDLSEQEGEIWNGVRRWLSLANLPFDRLTYGGYGSLLWIVDGQVKMNSIYPANYTFGKLFHVTKSIFEIADSNYPKPNLLEY